MVEVTPQVTLGQQSLTTQRQNPNEEYYQETLQNTDVKYQNITYWKYTALETVHGISMTPIDLQKALHEIGGLNQRGDMIGFTNGKNKDAINFVFNAGDRWYVEVPIFDRPEWDGYFWHAISDTKTVLDITRMFFDELEWFGMLDFKMSRNAAGARC